MHSQVLLASLVHFLRNMLQKNRSKEDYRKERLKGYRYELKLL